MNTPYWIRIGLIGLVVACGPKKAGDPAQQPDSTVGTEVGAVDSEATAEAQEAKPLHEQVNEAVTLLSDDPSSAAAQRAIGILEKALKEAPEDPVVRFNLGVARQRAGDVAGALREYQATVGQDPTVGRAWLHMGLIRQGQGQIAEAESDFRSGVRNVPEEMALRVALMDLMRSQGRDDQSIEEAKKALKIQANSLEIYNSMGLSYQNRNELALARFVYQKALNSIDGADENAYLHMNLGWTYYLDDDVPGAVAELTRALELDPFLIPALVNLSRIYLDDRNYEDTVPLLERAVSKAPSDPGVHMNLGIAYRGVGRHADAEKSYRQVMTLVPADPQPWFNLGILFGDYTKDYEASLDAFQKYLDAGGPEAERAEEYMKLVKREKKRVEKRKKAAEDRKQRDVERDERERLLKEAEKKAAAEAKAAASAPPAPEPAPDEAEPAPEDAQPATEAVPPEDESGEGESPPETQDAPPDAPAEVESGSPSVEKPEDEAPPDDAAADENPWGEPN